MLDSILDPLKYADKEKDEQKSKADLFSLLEEQKLKNLNQKKSIFMLDFQLSALIKEANLMNEDQQFEKARSQQRQDIENPKKAELELVKKTKSTSLHSNNQLKELLNQHKAYEKLKKSTPKLH